MGLVARIAVKLADRFAREVHRIGRGWDGGLYLTRWTLFGARAGGRLPVAVFLHQFHRSDADEMHDHPWPFVSVVLGGGYWEKTPGPGWQAGDGPTVRKWCGPGSVLVRRAKWIHSVEIEPGGPPVVTLIIRGRKQRSWGFWCPRLGYRPWRVHEARSLATGEGCG